MSVWSVTYDAINYPYGPARFGIPNAWDLSFWSSKAAYIAHFSQPGHINHSFVAMTITTIDQLENKVKAYPWSVQFNPMTHAYGGPGGKTSYFARDGKTILGVEVYWESAEAYARWSSTTRPNEEDDDFVKMFAIKHPETIMNSSNTKTFQEGYLQDERLLVVVKDIVIDHAQDGAMFPSLLVYRLTPALFAGDILASLYDLTMPQPTEFSIIKIKKWMQGDDWENCRIPLDDSAPGKFYSFSATNVNVLYIDLARLFKAALAIVEAGNTNAIPSQ